ncbi:uncharacterized protein LOC126370441 [Pectinophora gossypiella]|uniref:uncharacterized protein LOC126370441 n=1 Tax=Pectinophora gossypiella TaxID=13191 RepID=UPI00214ED2EC|nr:uncharacterized protein LOC126370441 [Pectinophora gossypiella]
MALVIEEARVKKSYNFDEAIDLTGTGWYNTGLLAATSISILAMCIDIFSLSIVVPLCSCDLQLDLMQKSILVSMPFLGPVFTAYCWGYVSDTQGRRLSLLLGMSVSFLMSTLSAFSPNWIVMAICKFLGTCFCSSAQSVTFALLGESCPERIKGKYMLVMSSIVHQGMAIYHVLAYLIAHNLDFSYDLGLIKFVPWRLLILVLALPLGLSAMALMFFYESPKFLLNAGREDEALEVLRRIYRRNCKKTEYPVEKLEKLNEKGNFQTEKVSRLQSLRDQTVPLFKPPLLFNTILLYCLLVVAYGVSGSLYIWLPFIATAYTSDSGDYSQGLCSVISQNNTISSSSVEDNCQAVNLTIVIAILISANFYTFLNFLMSKVASRKRLLMLGILSFASVSCFLITVIPNRASGIAYLGVLSTSICMGPTFAYFVELFPTSYRGMAACLGVMVARISSVAGINLVGPFITNQCTYTFYALTAILISGVLMSLLLPPDRPKAIQ